MFERKIEDTIAFLLKETIADQETITSRQIFTSDTPDSLKRMFEQDVDLWVKEEKERLLQSPHFRYDESDIGQLFEQIIVRARDFAVFSRDEYLQKLDKNVKLLFNYLCRPQWTLQKYLYADREHAATDDIIDGLQYFWNYEYYRVILREYFNKKELTVMQARKFAELLNHVDSEVVRQFDSRKLAHLSEPIFDLFSIGSASEEKFVPVESLSIFYDDKNLVSVVERLDREKEQREQITMHDLVMLISEVDFTMSYDISAIVNEHVHQAGVMKPERHVTAGKDFEIPEIAAQEHEEENRREIGEEDADLDFVITEEEDAVVEQHYDTIPSMQDDFLLEELEEEKEESEQELKDLEQVEQQTEFDREIDEFVNDNIEMDVDEFIVEEEELADDLPPETDDFHTSILDEEEDISELDDYESTVETILDIEAQLQEQDEIPDMSLNEEEEYSLVEEEVEHNAEEHYGGSSSASSYGSDSDTRGEVPDLSVVIPDDSSDTMNMELDIDWEKEAEDIPDVDLDAAEDDRGTLPQDAVPDVDLNSESQLKPAEELLGELDLDDFDEIEDVKPASHHDIPIVEEDVRSVVQDDSVEDDSDEAAMPARPVEEVIAEFGDLNQLIPVAEKKKYIKRLFQKDEGSFNNAMNILNGKPSWREASEYIDELFIKYDVDMYSRLAVKFTDDVYKRYLNKK